MENTLVISMLCIFSIVFLSPTYGDRQTFFRHRGQPIERRSSPDDNQSQNVENQWFKRYYHAKTPEFEKNSHPASTFSLSSPEEFLWLMKKFEGQQQQQQHENAAIAGYPSGPLDRDMEPLKYAPSFGDDEENADDAIDYRDVYNFRTSMADNSPMEDGLQQALLEYLMQQNNPSVKTSNDEAMTESHDDTSESKKASVMEIPTETPSLASSTISITSAPVKDTSEATSLNIVTSSPSNLLILPPVSTGKGQKEFAMLRPASENSRKFDNWAQNFEKSITANHFDDSRDSTTQQQQYSVDALTEQLNKLKGLSRRGIKKSQFVWY